MKHTTLAASLCFLTACSPAPQSTETSTSAPASQNAETTQLSESEKLSDFFAKSFEADLEQSPMWQSYLGLKWNYGEWDEVTEVRADQRIATLKERLATAGTFDESALNESEQLSLSLFKLAIERELANDEFRHHTYIMHQFRAFHTMVPSFLINIHRVESVSDAEAYISRLNGVNTLFDQVIEQLRIRQEKGVFPPDWSYDQMIQAATNVIQGNPFLESAEDSTIWVDVQAKINALEISNAEKNGPYCTSTSGSARECYACLPKTDC